MAWRVDGVSLANAIDVWVVAENPDSDLCSHVYRWFMDLMDAGPYDIPGLLLQTLHDGRVMFIQGTRVRVNMLILDDTRQIFVRSIRR